MEPKGENDIVTMVDVLNEEKGKSHGTQLKKCLK